VIIFNQRLTRLLNYSALASELAHTHPAGPRVNTKTYGMFGAGEDGDKTQWPFSVPAGGKAGRMAGPSPKTS